MSNIDDFDKEISEVSAEICAEVISVTKKAVEKTAKETNRVIKDSADFKNRTGNYVKAFKLTTTKDTPTSKEVTWHVEAPHYRLTHLLEYGHATRNGGRTRAFPHIGKGADYAEKRLEDLITEGLSDIE